MTGLPSAFGNALGSSLAASSAPRAAPAMSVGALTAENLGSASIDHSGLQDLSGMNVRNELDEFSYSDQERADNAAEIAGWDAKSEAMSRQALADQAAGAYRNLVRDNNRVLASIGKLATELPRTGIEIAVGSVSEGQKNVSWKVVGPNEIETQWKNQHVPGPSMMSTIGDPENAAGRYLRDSGALDSRAGQMQFRVAQQLPMGVMLLAAVPTSLNSFVAGGIVGLVSNGGAQMVIKDYEVNRMDLLDLAGATAAGSLTFGKGFAASATINGYGAYKVAEIKGEDPTFKVLGAVVGSGVGGAVGGFVEKAALRTAIPAAFSGNTRIADALFHMSAPSNVGSSAVLSETINYGADRVGDKLKPRKP